MNMKPNPLGHPMIGFAQMIIDTADKSLEDVGNAVERAIDSATETAKNRGVRLENVQVVPIPSEHDFRKTGLLLIFTIGRN